MNEYIIYVWIVLYGAFFSIYFIYITGIDDYPLPKVGCPFGTAEVVDAIPKDKAEWKLLEEPVCFDFFLATLLIVELVAGLTVSLWRYK
jgi:hypothetical protein